MVVPAIRVVVRAVSAMSCDFFISKSFFFITHCKTSAKNIYISPQPVVNPPRDPFEDFCDEPPAPGHVDPPAMAGQRPDDLAGGFFGGGDPKPGTFGHFGVDKTRLDVGYVEG